ncbi:unnamed protein product [Coffea canephora]|uniref:RNase H type-1 domain-containing protein n=1 Tax=Coffea canephora TaxID=49390 RepID=A0A068V1I5_COFCA|nr:unnamed protein product [Coffea canephora]
MGAESSSRRRCTPQGWNFLWGLKVKHKLKHFIWKCLQGILPVNAVIRERCSKGDSVCKCCGEYPETIEHLLFFCDNALAIWKVAPVSWAGLECLRNNFGHWWEEIREARAMESGQERIELTVNVLWQIWKSRNRRQFEDKGMDPMTVVNKATREWREFQEAQDVDGGNGSHTTNGKEGLGGWREPEVGWVKINSDAAVQQKAERAGWGMIARDCLGNALGAWAVPDTCCSSAKQEEALALRSAMLMAKQQGWRRVVFESDCKQLIDSINSGDGDSDIATILLDIVSLKSNFYKCCFSFTRRMNNSVSHSLAKLALSLDGPAEWKVVFPAWLLELLQADCRGSCSISV